MNFVIFGFGFFSGIVCFAGVIYAFYRKEMKEVNDRKAKEAEQFKEFLEELMELEEDDIQEERREVLN